MIHSDWINERNDRQKLIIIAFIGAMIGGTFFIWAFGSSILDFTNIDRFLVREGVKIYHSIF